MRKEAEIIESALYPYIPRQFKDQARRRFIRMCTAHILKSFVPGTPSLEQSGLARAAAPLVYAALKAERVDSDQLWVAAGTHWDRVSRQIDRLKATLVPPQQPKAPSVPAEPKPPPAKREPPPSLDQYLETVRQQRSTSR